MADAATLIGVVVTLIVSTVSLILTLRDNGESRYAATITDVRYQWIRDLRMHISEFVRLAVQCINGLNSEKLSEYYAEMLKCAFISRTHLGHKYKSLCDRITNIEYYVGSQIGKEIYVREVETPITSMHDFYNELNKIESESVMCFTIEWEHMRHEVKRHLK